jgi:hypothetical protein
MKKRIATYTFDASAKTITFSGAVVLEGFFGIVNVTDGILIYNPADPACGGSVLGAVLTLEYDTATMDDGDDLLILYDDAVETVAVTNANLDVALSTRTKPADQQHAIIDSGSCAVTAAALPLPSGAATATLQGGGLPGALAADGGLKVTPATSPMPVSGTVGITNLDVALSTRTKPADQQHAIIDSGSCAVTAAALPLPSGAATSALQGGGMPAALGAGGGLKIDGSGTALPVSGTVSAAVTAAVKQVFGAYTTLDVTHLQSLASSATAGWMSAIIDNRSTKAMDWRVQVKLTTADTAPGATAAAFVYIAPGMFDGANWVIADGGNATPPNGSEGTYTLAATTNNFEFLGALAYTTQHQTMIRSFCLSNAVGAVMPEGFVIVILNTTGAALSTGCVVAVEAITGGLS